MSEDVAPYHVTPPGPDPITAKALPNVPGFAAWRDALARPAGAELCLRYALAFNTLDFAWLNGVLAQSVTYESQSVFDKLQGVAAVTDYLTGKIQTLQQTKSARARGELATLASGQACVAMCQVVSGNIDKLLTHPVANTIFEMDEQGRATSIFMITTVPVPAEAVRSGIYPPLGCAI